MKEITILSGKGGTGKTSIAAALASLAKSIIMCDNDVDASNLHLIMTPEIREEYIFAGGWQAKIHPDKCTACGICKTHCRFDAIHYTGQGYLTINPYQCEGCRLCEHICPTKAITSHQSTDNYWYVSDTRFGTLIHATMGPGEENSGKLVTAVRKKAYDLAINQRAEYIINDGPPGIGCATIASLANTHMVLLVTEPTKSGLHDLKRLIELVNTFDIPQFAIINKYDINLSVTLEIEQFLKNHSIKILGRLPFHQGFIEAMINQKTITEHIPESDLTKQLNNIWLKVQQMSEPVKV